MLFRATLLLALAAVQQVLAAPMTAQSLVAQKRAEGMHNLKAVMYGDEYMQKRQLHANVITTNFPDPSIMQTSDGWYAFATRTPNQGIHVPVAHSTDFTSWSLVRNADGTQLDAMPSIPAWVQNPVGNYWGPDISHLDDGTWIMYFSATVATDPSQHCVGAAKSSKITGPYTSTSAEPLVCPSSEGGAIDPSGFQDPAQVGGTRYLLYKVDGNTLGRGGQCGNTIAPIHGTPIRLQQVGADGVTFVGNPVDILDNNGASDDGIVEAPSLLHADDGYYLFFSSGCFLTNRYTVSYAYSTALKGPYERRAPLFKADTNGMTRPGGADVFRDGRHLVFHDGPQGARHLDVATITAKGGVVTVN